MSGADEVKALTALVRPILESVREAGKKGDAAKKREAIAAARQRAMPAFVEMRRQWREMHGTVHDLQAQVTRESVRLDSHFLQLQNLRYQQHHLEREIRACQETALPAFESLEMLPEEEFRSSVKQAGREPPAEAHALMLSRLAHEREVRQGLQERCTTLKETLEQHRTGIRTRQRAMESIPGLVDEVEKASLPLQKRMGMTSTKRLSRHEAAQELPPPLYVLYAQFEGLADTCRRQGPKEAEPDRERVTVVLKSAAPLGADPVVLARAAGMPEEAVSAALAREGSRKRDRGEGSRSPSPSQPAPSPSAGMEEEEEGEGEGATGAGGAESSAAAVQQGSAAKRSLSELFCKHPKAVSVCVRAVAAPVPGEEGGGERHESIKVLFELWPALGTLTAAVEDSSVQGGAEELLGHLFPGDDGATMPSVAACHTAGITAWPRAHTGLPLHWAQWVAGIYTLPPKSPLPGALTPSLRAVATRLRQRLRARARLLRQLAVLGSVPAVIPATEVAADRLPTAVEVPGAALKAFNVPDSGEVASAGEATGAGRAGDGEESDYGRLVPAGTAMMLCRATFAVEGGPLVEAEVRLAHSYPSTAPVVLLGSQDKEASPVLPAVEDEVNGHLDELRSTQSAEDELLFLTVLRKVQVCLDAALNPARTASAPRRGPLQLPPLAYDPASKSFLHR